MTLRCWNCDTEDSRDKSSTCSLCGEFLQPEAEQRVRARERIEYLIRELKRWTSVPEWWKKEAEDNYRQRLANLRDLTIENRSMVAPAAVPAAEIVPPRPLVSVPPGSSDPGASIPVDVPIPVVNQVDKAEVFQILIDQSEQLPPTYSPSEADLAMQMLMGAFSEKKIRLLYALGGVLLLAAGVGILGSHWEGWGRQALALLLTILPALFFWLATKLREKLPVSSRMFTALGGAMLPIGLLFLGVWRPLAFFIGFAVNLYHCKESVCIYLCGFCWALAGWTIGSGLPLGIMAFVGAGIILKLQGSHLHWSRVAHGLSLVGLLSAFTRGAMDTGTATTLFLLAITYFTTCSLFLTTSGALLGASLISLLCAAWLSFQLQWPASTVGLAALLQGGLYLRRNQPLALILPAVILVIFVGLPMLINPYAANATQLVTGLLGTVFYTYAAVFCNKPNWAYSAAFCALYSYFTLLSLTSINVYRPWMVGLLLVVQVIMVMLRNKVDRNYLRPWAFTAAGTALLLVPLNISLQMAGADVFTPWIYLGVSASIALCAVFEQESRALYASMVTAALAYATWLPIWFGKSSEPNLGLAFTAFVVAMALMGLALRKTTYGKPLLMSAALAGYGFSYLQFYYIAIGYWSTATVALIIYGLGFALPRKEATNFQAGICLLTALGSFDHMGSTGLLLGLIACSLLLKQGGYAEAGLAWSAGVAVLGPPHLQALPALIWLVAAVLRNQPILASTSSLLLLPLIYRFELSNLNLLLVFVQCLGLLALAFRWKQVGLYLPAWILLKLVYFKFSPEYMSLFLWLEWGVFYYLNRTLNQPKVEIATSLCLLATSFLQGGWQAFVNPWLVVGLLIFRKQSNFAQAVVVWAALCGAEATQEWLTFPLELFIWCYIYPKSLNTLGYLAWLSCFSLGIFSVQVGILLLGAGAYAIRRKGNQAFGLLYHAYVLWLISMHIDMPEFYTIPPGLWLLRKSRKLGLILLLLPSVFLSLFLGEHALWAGSLALLLLISRQPNLMAWGGITLLTEVAIQAVMFASNLPWYQWSVAGGILLVSVAFLVERKRQQVMQASRRFMEHLGNW